MAATGSFTLPETVFVLWVPDDGMLPAASGIHVDVTQAHVVDLGLLGALRVDKDRISAVPGRDVAAPGLQIAYQKLLGRESWSLKTDVHLSRHMPTVKQVARGLVERGFLQEGRGKRLGILPVPVFPTNNPGFRQVMRERLRGVLSGGSEPQAHDAALFLLMGEELIGDLVDSHQRSDAKKRAGDIIAEASPEDSFLRGYAKARAKAFWRTTSSIQHWLDI